MARGKKKGSKSEEGEIVSREICPTLRALLGSSKTKFVDGSYMGKTADEQYFGIPIPCLAFQWMIKNTCLPLGKMIGLAGKSQSHKSSLGFEISRWVSNYHGYTHLVENEGGKYDAQLIRSIVGDESFENRFLISEVEDATQAQVKLTQTIKAVRENTNRDEMWLIDLDSMAGSETEDQTAEIDKQGFAGRAHPITALSWTRYLKRIVALINTYPVVFLSVNHLKEKPSAMPGMPATKTTPGGAAQRFHSALYFWVSRINSSERSEWEINGETVIRPTTIRTIQLECEKSSLGPDKRKIEVNLCFYDGLDGKPHAYVDWDTATAVLLMEMQSELGIIREGDVSRYGRLRELLHIDVQSKRYTCKQLELEGVEAFTLGKAVHENPALMSVLTDFFGIKRNLVWSGAMPKPAVEPELPDENGDNEFPTGPASVFDAGGTL
jgi:hypothetical protein